jgi:phosphate transport system protein
VKTQAITLVKEDVLSLGRTVNDMVAELTKLLGAESEGDFQLIEKQEEEINGACLRIEEKCLDVLNERHDLKPKEIRTLVCSTLMAAKFERLADHAHRVAKLAGWAKADGATIPSELIEMASCVHRMVEETLLCFLSDDLAKVVPIVQSDSQINYLHDLLSKRLLTALGGQAQEEAQARAQFLFCARYIERMGDCCASIAKRIHFVVTGERISPEV